MFNALSFTRRCSRFLMIACLLAVSVPAGFAIGTDGAAYAASSRGGGGGGGGGDGGGSGDGRGNKVLECLGGLCVIETECDGPCYPPPECEGPNCGQPPCVGPLCDSSTSDTPPTFTTYQITPAGCQSSICSVSEDGKKKRCYSRKVDEKMCVQKNT
jgi:hypothetical protein